MTRILLFLAALLIGVPAEAQVSIWTSRHGTAVDLASPGAIGGTTPAAITGTTITATTKMVTADTGGGVTPSYTFSGDTNLGFLKSGSSQVAFRTSGGYSVLFGNAGLLTLNGANAVLSLNGSAGISANASGVLEINDSGTLNAYRDLKLRKLRVGQATVPTCSSNCGTSPTVVGSDSAGTVTMGATGTPASGFVITFNGTWAAAPSCVMAMGLGSMTSGKIPLVVATTTTTITVTTGGTAPGNSDVYHYHCIGVQ